MKKVALFWFVLSLALLISLSSSSASTPNPNFEALLSFKASADRSGSLSSWSDSAHPCSWLGVTCDPTSTRVTQLVLENLNLTGSIEPLARLTQLRLLSLKNNNLFSSSLDLSPFNNLVLLYLSHNRFSGRFPSGIAQLRRLRRIDLAYNRFSGEIPLNGLVELPHLLTLRLESNSFDGVLVISSKLVSLETLVEFNVSINNLSGGIPKPLSVFPSSSFDGNGNLCGKPLLNECSDQGIGDDPIPVDLPSRPVKKRLSGRSILVILLVALCGVVLIVITIALCFRAFKRHNQRGLGMKEKEMEVKRRIAYENEEMVFFQGSKRFKVEELLRGSAEMLGKGSVGSTYKVVMENGDIVVVKRVRERRKKKEIEGLLREIGGLRHRNVASLRAYYCSGDELLLVYDYHHNGSLDSLLHGNRGPGRTPLDWSTRLGLALDVAEGLMFIHDATKSKLSHGHLTSSNVVIDQEGKACISDTSLHQLFQIETPKDTEYKAPELLLSTHSSRRYSQRSDVYSFGVILLEMLTGKMEASLVSWVLSVGREKWVSEVFDFELLAHKETDEEEMVALMEVSLRCLTPVPQDRPKINAVYKMIRDIRSHY